MQILSLVPNPRAVIKNENLTNDAEAITIMQLSDATTASYDRVCAALLPVCPVFNVPLQQHFEALELSGDDISGWVGLVLSDRPYNTRCVYGRHNLEYD